MGKWCFSLHAGDGVIYKSMSAAYDTFDYPAYWEGRDYEHKSEAIAISKFLKKIGKCNSLLEIGCGFGRLAPLYYKNAKSITLSDPSKNLLVQAKKQIKNKNVKFLNSNLQNLVKNSKTNSFDTIVMVRVLHHLETVDQALDVFDKLIKKNGYIILEFANKLHGKAILKNFLRGNFTFPLEIFPSDKRSDRNIEKGSILFQNYHPDTVRFSLEKHGYQILEMRSVSNIRSTIMKRYVPERILLWVERNIQKPFAQFYFGPSIFVLARKS